MPCNGSPSQLWRNVAESGPVVAVSESNGQQNREFQFQSVADGRCLMAATTSYTVGPGLLLDNCTQVLGPPEHRFGPALVTAMKWSMVDQSLVLLPHLCCGDIFSKRPVCLAVDTFPTCSSPQLRAKKWCDTTLAPAARAAALLAQMTLLEKASNMDSQNFGVPRLGMPPLIFSEALHGMCSGCGATHAFDGYVSSGCPTSFPQVISMGASFNRTLWRAVGAAVSNEVRGLYAQGGRLGWEAALFLWAPNVNPFRDPRLGRGQEVASEEPLVCAEYAAQYIPGLQGEVYADGQRVLEGGAPHGGSQTPRYLKTVATAKHFFDYDLEGVGATKRTHVDVNVTARDQVEYFSPPFEAAVTRGRTRSVMCSYNAVNGVPACFSSNMINGKMRGEWGFDGFVTSDCDALSDAASHDYIVRHFNGSLRVQAQQAVRGGTDLNCGALYGEQLVGAVTDGLLKESELDQALTRIYSLAFELGVPDGAAPANPNPYAKLSAADVDTPAHRALALEAALQGIVMLKNDAATLPLNASTVGKLALIGPHANGSYIFLGGPNYHGVNTIVTENTPLQRARAWMPHANVSYSQGCTVAGSDTSGLDAAVATAAAADAVVLFLGLDETIENEGRDRTSLGLPGVQTELALRVAAASKAPITVVLVNGGPVAISELKTSAKVGAILEAFMPGQYAAEALMRLLVGHASPSALLPVTVYDADFVDRRPITNLNLRDAGGVTYRYFEGKPLWPFGFGMSYANLTFKGDASAMLNTTVAAAPSAPLCLSVEVSNGAASKMASDVVVLGFIASAHADAPRNPKLCDFAREAAIKPAEAREVKLCVNNALALVDEAGNERVLPGEYTVTVGTRGGVGGAGAGSVIGRVFVSA